MINQQKLLPVVIIITAILLVACGELPLPSETNVSINWADFELTDARTGDSFTIADYAGKTVFVHMMAQWCIDCWVSQNNLRDHVAPVFQGDDVVFLSLDVDHNDSPTSLAEYADDNGFEWQFAVATPELLDTLVTQFGRTVITPPAQPHFVISASGAVGELDVGNRPAQYNIDRIRSAG